MNVFPYQREGIDWMKKRESDTSNEVKGGILADQMGMGKTLQIAMLIKEKKVRKTLLILPAVVTKDWTKLFDTLNIKYAVYPSVIKEKSKKARVQIYTNGYLCRMSPQERLRINKWDRVVIDEGHFLLNGSSCQSKNLRELHTKFWWVISATPVKLNNEFKYYFRLFNDPSYNIRTRADLDKMMLARKIKDVPYLMKNFPEKTVRIKVINPPSDESSRYRNVKERSIQYQMPFLEQSIRLMQATVDVDLSQTSIYNKYKDPDDRCVPSDDIYFAKYKAMIDDLNKDIERPTIIFCRFKREIELFKQQLTKQHTTYGIIDGDHKDLDIISNGSSKSSSPPTVLLCQVSVASVGLNLQHYNRVFLTMPMWSLWTQDQAIARSYRYGQKNKVDATIYSLSGTIDEYLLRRHEMMKDVW